LVLNTKKQGGKRKSREGTKGKKGKSFLLDRVQEKKKGWKGCQRGALIWENK